MTKGKPQTTKNNTAQENLTERLERKETVRGTALTITGGFLWGIAGVFGKYTFEYKGVTATWIRRTFTIHVAVTHLSTKE